MGGQPLMDLKLYRQPLMILYIESKHDGFATYQNQTTRLTISNDLEAAFSSNPPAGMRVNEPRQLQKLENSNNYIIEGTAALLAVLSFNRIKIIE